MYREKQKTMCQDAAQLSTLSVTLILAGEENTRKKILNKKCTRTHDQHDRTIIFFLISEFACDLFLQALPYVALLILMLFFIYAVVGMQVYMQTETYT